MTEGACDIPGPTEPLKRFPGFLGVGTLVDGRYEVTGYLGEGGFATLYRARHVQIQREVALKVLDIPRTAGDSDSFEKRFVREARIAASIDHPNVVTIHDFGSFGEFGQLYIAMELLHGHDLDEELERVGSLEPKRALRLMCECLEALGAGHKLGIVHKDLKPANLFLTHPGQRRETLTLLDFGVAIKAEQLTRYTQTGEICGTPRYLAPEYIDSQTALPATDVYQMGLVLAEMLLGLPVVRGDTGIRCIMEHLSGVTVPPELRRLEIGEVIERALALEPEDRFADATEFQNAILAVEDWSAQRPTEVPPLELHPRVEDTEELAGVQVGPHGPSTRAERPPPGLDLRIAETLDGPIVVPLSSGVPAPEAGPSAALTGPVTKPLSPPVAPQVAPSPISAPTPAPPRPALSAVETAQVRSQPIKSRYHARCIAAVGAIDKIGRERPTGLHYFQQASGGKARHELVASETDAAPWPQSDPDFRPAASDTLETTDKRSSRPVVRAPAQAASGSSGWLKLVVALGVALCALGGGLLVAVESGLVGDERQDDPAEDELAAADTPAVAEEVPMAEVMDPTPPPPPVKVPVASVKAKPTTKVVDPIANQKAMLKTLHDKRRAIDQCFEKGRRRRPELAGKLTIRLVAKKNGRLASANVMSDSLGDDKVAQCITARTKRWRYKISGSRGATLITTLTFPRSAGDGSPPR